MRYKSGHFKKKLLAASISSSVLATLGVHAQDGPTAVEEVQVVGIRASLQSSMNTKRESSGIVDAITAEDIGKFPDTNLAESLQRITGVSIERAYGEGSKVTVRGFGPDNNLITLNGRQLPTTTGDRTFDFDNVASEAVSAVEVYKTSDATVTSGGMGATINLKTHRPLDAPGLKATVGAKLVDDRSTDKGSTTPELSGLYSQTFADDTFGIALFGSYQERESGMQEFIDTQGYRAGEYTNTGWGGVPAGAAGGTNRPTSGIYSNPQQPRYSFEERQRERMNGQLVLQFAPNDSVTATLDYTFVENTTEVQHTDVSVWFNYAGDRSETVWAGEPNAYPLIYSEIYPQTGAVTDLRDSSLTVGSWGQVETIDSFGLNVEFEVNDQLSFVLDMHSSEGEIKASDPRHGTGNNIQLPSYTRTQTGLDLTGGLPGIATSQIELFNPDTFQLSGSWFQNNFHTSEIDQIQLAGAFEFNDEFKIDFGVGQNTVNNRFRFTTVERTDWGGIGEQGDFSEVNGIDWTEDTVLNHFQESPNNFEGTASQADYDLFDRIWYADFDEIVAVAEVVDQVAAATGGRYGDCQAAPGAAAGPGGAGQFCASTDWDANRNEFTEEETLFAFVKFNFEGQMGDMPFDANLGLRYETTDVLSTASVAGYSEVVWREGTATAIEGQTDIETQSKTASYSKVLPNLNFNLNVTEDIIARAALSKSISRASYTDLLGGTVVNTTGTLSGYQGNSGNPGLEPLESTNFDLSGEWYYDESSYVSLGYFRKKVKNWISTGTEPSQIYNLPNPFDGEKFDAAVAALQAGGDPNPSNQDIRTYIFENYADDPYVFPDDSPNGGEIYGDPATDNVITFNINIPVNSDTEHTIDGFEFNVQHFFGESGFGTVFNYTMVDTALEYDNTSLSDTEALIGLSDTSNLVAFYDKDGWQVRLAYNWRDEFLSQRQVNADLTAPRYTEAYSQIDFSVSYDLPMMDGLTVFLEGINITDEYIKVHGRVDPLVYQLTQQGARYNLGARYTF